VNARLLAFAHASLASLLRVKVAKAAALDDNDLPNVSGEYQILEDGIGFVPHFPFEPGVRFQATLDLRAWGQTGVTEVLELEFSLPRETGAGDTVVSEVFPSNTVLPENLLRFYIRFARPMRRGGAENNIALLGPDGAPAPDALYRAPVELWNSSMTRLTVLLDPGRLKRGVGPNRTLGPPLRVGQRYTLGIASGMIDMCGRPLCEGFSKHFRVSDAVREPIAVEKWKIRPPAKGSYAPLELTFPAPLDWAGLWRGISVATDGGRPVSGRIEVDRGETRWRFIPDAVWRGETYSVRVSPGLEDVCGNTPYAPFDGPIRSASHVALAKAVRSIPFAPRRNGSEFASVIADRAAGPAARSRTDQHQPNRGAAHG